MRIHFSPLGKTMSGFFLIGAALLITGWTIADNTQSVPAVSSSAPTPMLAVTQNNPLVKKVQDALAKKAELKGEDIKVEAADGGKIQLSGKTSHHTKRTLALKVAENAAGKKNVVNQLFTQCNGQLCPSNQQCCCTSGKNPVCSCQDKCSKKSR